MESSSVKRVCWRIFLNIHIVECNSDNPIINVSQGWPNIYNRTIQHEPTTGSRELLTHDERILSTKKSFIFCISNVYTVFETALETELIFSKITVHLFGEKMDSKKQKFRTIPS